MKTPPKTVLFLDHKDVPRSRLAASVFNAVAGKMGLPWQAASRLIVEVTLAELERAQRIVALNQTEHVPLIAESFPSIAKTVECWQVEDVKEPSDAVEREVHDLVARILSGGERKAPLPKSNASEKPVVKSPTKKPVTLKVGRETAGRRGKGVTTVFDTPLNATALQELAATLKQKCGTGGTVKDGRIEIQGDQRERIVAELEKLGYLVKRAGG